MAKYKEIYSEWSANEKSPWTPPGAITQDAAHGATKQVRMNVLSDSLFYTAYTGAEAPSW
ncbi:MAG: hypothetical protein ACLSTO_10225 [Bilophila wadsworthia]